MIMFVGSIICFGIAGFVYRTYLNIFNTFAYYGVAEKNIYSNPEILDTIANLKFGIIKFTILGILGIIFGLFFLLKKFKSYEQENH